MNFTEATEALKRYDYLLQTDYRGKAISALVIAPLNGKAIAEIIQAVQQNKAYYQYLHHTPYFQIIALLDPEEYHQGMPVPWVKLELILKDQEMGK